MYACMHVALKVICLHCELAVYTVNWLCTAWLSCVELDNSGKLEGYELRAEESTMQRKPELLSNVGEVPYVLATERGKFSPKVSRE